MVKQRVLRCRLCGHEWEPLVVKPKVCPRCKRYDWLEPIPKRRAAPISPPESTEIPPSAA